MGCNDTYTSGRHILNLSEHKKREDWYDEYWGAYFFLPGNVSGFYQVNIFPYFFKTVVGLFQARWQGNGTSLYGLFTYVCLKGNGDFGHSGLK